MFSLRTLFLSGAISCLICALMLYSSRRVHSASREAVLHAAGAEILLGLAMLLIALRTVVPDWISIVLANACGTSGGILIYTCVRRIAGLPIPRGPIALLFAACVLLQVALGTSPANHLLRLSVTSVAQGAFVAATIPLLYGRRHLDAPMSLAWGIGFAGLYAGAHLARLAWTLFNGVSVDSGGMVTGSLPVTLMAVLFSVAPMVFAITLIGLVNGRLGNDLLQMASTDPLTGLATRRSFFAKATRLIGDVEGDADAASSGGVVAVMMLDLDRFKKINDRYGHLAGDAVLMRFARILQLVAPTDAALGRYGGEEFCLLVRSDSAESARYLAGRICRATRHSHENASSASGRIRVTVSIGVAVAPADGHDLEGLLMIADRRVYLAKTLGRNRVVASEGDVTLTMDKLTPRSMVEV